MTGLCFAEYLFKNTDENVMLIYLALVSAVAYSLWGMLLKYNPISRVAVFGFHPEKYKRVATEHDRIVFCRISLQKYR